MNRFSWCSIPVTIALLAGPAAGQETTIRSTAVVDLTFDESDGPADDRAASGTVKDAAQPKNGVSRIVSPFWNVTDGKAVRLDAARKQFFQIADSADLDHADGTTLSFYFLNLHELTDATFHGITAKRHPKSGKTNYGLNYQPSSKKLQVYVNDGSGYKVVGFPVEAAFGVRRLAHLTATFRHGDAPEADADADADDLEIRLIVNGKALKPIEAKGGVVTPDSGWVTDVNKAGLLNDTPLTIGGSYANGETVSGLIDDYLVFNRPLSPEEAANLFVEVAGPDGERLAKLETEGMPSSRPVISNIVPRGLQVGMTTRITVLGRNLSNPTLSLLGMTAHVAIPDSTSKRLVADVTIPADAAPTMLSLAVVTPQGISDAMPLPVDRLPQQMIPEFDASKPVELPAAFTGTLKGNQRQRIVFDGKQGQRFVAEIELKRLGGTADPVLELKSESGVPIEIAWGRSIRGGDPRLVATLPQDGRYTLELHDLAWKAGTSPFRLLAGDLHLLDNVVPSTVEAGTNSDATPLGVGLDGTTLALATATGEPTATLAGSAVAKAQGVLPIVTVGTSRVLDEQEATAKAVDVTSDEVRLAGRLVEPGEVDRFVLQTVPGKAIVISVEAKTIGSPVEPELTVYEGDRQIGRKTARPGTGTVSLKVTPKASTGTIEVRVSDRLADVEGVARPYRLRLVPAGTPQLDVTLLDSSIVLPSAGRGVMRVRVERRGPVREVRLIPGESSGVVLEPAVIPAGKASSDVFITASAAPGREAGKTLTLVAEASTPSGTLRRPVRVAPSEAVTRFDATRPQFQAPIVVGSAAPAVELAGVPSSIFKGTSEQIGVKIAGPLPDGYAVRFSLVSDEPTRPNDPKKPAAGNKPLVRLSDDAAVPPDVREAKVTLLVPADVAVKEIRAVVKAEVVPHSWSQHVVAVGYSAPISFTVDEAIATAATETVSLGTGENQLAITMQRSDGFAEPVTLELRGLPKGYAAVAAAVPAAQSAATLKVIVPDGSTAGPLPNLELAILAADGSLLKSIKPFTLTVKPDQ